MQTLLVRIVLAASAVCAMTASAAPIRIQFEGYYTDQWVEFMPLGTKVSGEFVFEFTNPGRMANTEVPEITRASGKLAWGNGYAESVWLNSASWNSYGTDGLQGGELAFAFPSSFSTNGREVHQVHLTMYYPDNPYTSTRSWDGLTMISTTGNVGFLNLLNGEASVMTASSWEVSRVEIPEPGTLGILGLGLVGLAALRRKDLSAGGNRDGVHSTVEGA